MTGPIGISCFDTVPAIMQRSRVPKRENPRKLVEVVPHELESTASNPANEHRGKERSAAAKKASVHNSDSRSSIY